MIERGYLSEKKLIYTDNTNPDNDILVKHSLPVLLGYMRSCWYVVRQQEQALACCVYQWDIVEQGHSKTEHIGLVFGDGGKKHLGLSLRHIFRRALAYLWLTKSCVLKSPQVWLELCR